MREVGPVGLAMRYAKHALAIGLVHSAKPSAFTTSVSVRQGMTTQDFLWTISSATDDPGRVKQLATVLQYYLARLSNEV